MDKSKLKQLYSNFLLLSFPLSEGHRKAAEWIADLGRIDSYYTNLAERLVMGNSIQGADLPSLKSLADDLKQLQHAPGISEQRYQEYKLYLSSLKKLAKEIEKAIN